LYAARFCSSFLLLRFPLLWLRSNASATYHTYVYLNQIGTAVLAPVTLPFQGTPLYRILLSMLLIILVSVLYGSAITNSYGYKSVRGSELEDHDFIVLSATYELALAVPDR
jgi:hypothetical protein